MLWKGRRQSTNVEDRRGMSAPRVAMGGGLGLIALLLLVRLLGGDPVEVLETVQPPPQSAPQSAGPPNPEEEELVEFVSVVLADTEDVWHQLFAEMGENYQEPKLVLFTDQVQSACGFASAAVGPFYCPPDANVYLDLAFFDELKNRFGAPGDFAQAYVIAHEIGHHVQNLMGISEQVQAEQRRLSRTQANELSVRLELQADFLAGVWAHHAEKNWHVLDAEDITEALRAASAIGDDRLQRQAQGYVVPDAFTHGTSEQRVRWFRRGLETGDIEQGNTFSATDL